MSRNFTRLKRYVYIQCSTTEIHRPITDGVNIDQNLDIDNGVLLEKVDKFCYLGDADRGCDSAITSRVRSAWKKISEYLPILTGKGSR